MSIKVGDTVRVVNYWEPAEGQVGTVIGGAKGGLIDVKLPIVEESDGSYWWVFMKDELEVVTNEE